MSEKFQKYIREYRILIPYIPFWVVSKIIVRLFNQLVFMISAFISAAFAQKQGMTVFSLWFVLEVFVCANILFFIFETSMKLYYILQFHKDDKISLKNALLYGRRGIKRVFASKKVRTGFLTFIILSSLIIFSSVFAPVHITAVLPKESITMILYAFFAVFTVLLFFLLSQVFAPMIMFEKKTSLPDALSESRNLIISHPFSFSLSNLLYFPRIILMAIALDYALIFELFFDIIAAGEAGMTLSMLVCQEILSLANLFILYDLLLFGPFTFFRFSRLYRKLHTKPAEPIRFSLILECMVCLVPAIFIAIRFLELISYLVQYIL